MIGQFAHLFPVHSIVHRLAHQGVVEWRPGDVKDKGVEGEAGRLADDLDSLGRIQQFDVGQGNASQQVDAASQQVDHSGLVIGNGLDHHFVQVGFPLPPIVLELDQVQVVTRNPLLILEGAGADRHGGDVSLGFLGKDIQPGDAVERRVCDLAVVEIDGIVVHLGCAGAGPEAVSQVVAQLLVVGAFDRPDDVVGRHLATIVEHDPLAQMEGDRCAIFTHLVRFGQPRLECTFIADANRRLENERLKLGAINIEVGVEIDKVGAQRHVQRAARQRPFRRGLDRLGRRRHNLLHLNLHLFLHDLRCALDNDGLYDRLYDGLLDDLSDDLFNFDNLRLRRRRTTSQHHRHHHENE